VAFSLDFNLPTLLLKQLKKTETARINKIKSIKQMLSNKNPSILFHKSKENTNLFPSIFSQNYAKPIFSHIFTKEIYRKRKFYNKIDATKINSLKTTK